MGKYLKKYLEMGGMGSRVDVPEFETREEAEAFIDDLDPDDIVMDDVIDPETGDVLLEKGETKESVSDEGSSATSAYNRYMKMELGPEDNRSVFDIMMDRHKEKYGDAFDIDDEIEGEEEPENNTDYELMLNTISAEYEDMGADIIGDWMYDNPDADEDDAEEFINSMAFEGVGEMDDEVKTILRKAGIRDFEGWAADYVADGARRKFKEERG